MLVQKTDLANQYDFNQVRTAQKKEQKKWMYIVLIGCFLLQALPYCVAMNLLNVFAGSDWIVWLSGNAILLNLTFTMGAVAAAIASPVIASILNKKINMRIVYSIGVVLAMVGFALIGINAFVFDKNNHIDQSTAASILWVPTIITQIGVMVFSGLGVNNLISKWWAPEKRGIALGIAFAGGSVGNMCLQPLLGYLSGVFGNAIARGKPAPNFVGYVYSVATGGFEQVGGHQWATYFILAGTGLIAGLIVVMVICKKPIPPIVEFEQNLQGALKPDQTNQLAASFLDTRKYAPYWILAIGYGILQMGTVHASMNGQIIQNATVVANSNLDYRSIMSTGGILFGVGCLIGNLSGGILNDKLGPTKSISLAGSVQCGAILCLLFSIIKPELVYIYFILAGLSVYVYTSTPAFTAGRLYGAKTSNTHVAIYGLFIAGAFAIVNSISGAITGDYTVANSHEFMGKTIHGNCVALLYFALACMAVGTIIVVTCSYIISKKGIKGICEYSPTKYSKIIFFRRSIAINLSALRILLSHKDFRNNPKRINKIAKLEKKCKYQLVKDDYIKAVDEVINNDNKNNNKISNNQKLILSNIFFYEIIEKNNLLDALNNIDIKSFNQDLNDLIKNQYLTELKIGNDLAYMLSPNLKLKLQPAQIKLYENNNKLLKTAWRLNDKFFKEDNKLNNNINKLNKKLDIANHNKDILLSDLNKQNALNVKSGADIELISKQRTKDLNKKQNASPWSQYKIDYSYAQKILLAQQEAHLVEDKANNKIKKIQKQMFSKAYISNYNKLEHITGQKLLFDYYNNELGTYDALINQSIANNFDRKLLGINNKIDRLNIRLNNINNKDRDNINKDNNKSSNNKQYRIDKINSRLSKLNNKLQSIQSEKNKLINQLLKA